MNSSPAYIFPGQGAQHVGMAAELIQQLPQVKALFEKGSDLTGHDLITLVTEGPLDRLSRTDVSQVAIFLHSMGVLQAIQEATGEPPVGSAACGLSLGEYSALVFAGSIDLMDALAVVAKRGAFMQEAADREKGAMLTILGMEKPQVETLIQQAKQDDVLVLANWNSPQQLVASGHENAIDRLETLASEHGARRVIRLKVAGAFHSPLMASAEEKLRPFLERLTIRPPCVPFIPNITGCITDDPEKIRTCLMQQVTGTVLWTPTVEKLAASGVTRAVEAGPGRVLAGLIKRTMRQLPVTSVSNLSDAACLKAQ